MKMWDGDKWPEGQVLVLWECKMERIQSRRSVKAFLPRSVMAKLRAAVRWEINQGNEVECEGLQTEEGACAKVLWQVEA